MSVGVGQLIEVLRDIQTDLHLDAVSVDVDLPDGHRLTLRAYAGGLVEFERDDGRIILTTP